MWSLALLIPLALMHYAVAIHSRGWLTTDGLFVASQLIMVVGTARLINGSSARDVAYLHVMVLGVCVYLVTSSVTAVVARVSAHRTGGTSIVTVPPTPAIIAGIVASLAVVAAYYYAVGYSAWWVGVQGLLNDQRVDMATLRLQSYAGGRYLFPGYVNQFKNIILPALSVVVASWAFIQRPPRWRILSVLLIAAAVLGLIGTGQRGAFVTAALVVATFAYLCAGQRLSRAVLLVPTIGLPLLMLSTVVLGRDDATADTRAEGSLLGIWRRIMVDNQLAGTYAYRYTSWRPTVSGSEWWAEIRGILPGDRGSSLANDVFAFMYGSHRGTAPPSLWGSIHYNFGTIGVVVIATALGAAFQLITVRTITAAERNTLQLIGIAGITVTLGTWIAGGPGALLNGGLVPYVALWWWGRRIGSAPRPDRLPPVRPA
jgi:hypothetical protein